MDPDRLIPGPDPGACPRCGEWLKAGMTHRCEGGEARNHEADIHAVALRAFHRALDLDDAHMDDAVRAAVVAALDAVRRSPQGEDHEAEVEAVARAMYETYDAAKRQPWKALKRDSPNAAHRWMEQGEVAIAALDALRRSPQGESRRKGHDPGCVLPSAHKGPCRPRSPQGEDHEPWAESEAERLRESLRQANLIIADLARLPSPQGEDHEAGIDIAEDAYQRLVAAGFTPKTADGMLRAYLSRCPSPERDTEKLLAFGREHGIAALLDHLGLDELGNEVSRLVEALFEAKGAIPSDRGELHRRLGRILSEFSDASKDSRVSPDHDPGRTD